MAVVFSLLVVGAMAFAYFEPVQVLPRMRVAPGYAFVDQHGETYTSESGRGVITLYTFSPIASPAETCANCDTVAETMASVADQIEASVSTGRSETDQAEFEDVEIRLVTVALGSAQPADLARAAEAYGADGERWRWIGTDDLARLQLMVGEGFRRYFEAGDDGEVKFDPGYVIVDGNGVIRGEYRYETLASNADKLADHLDILVEEVRSAHGPAAVAYEAAHLFLCYP